MSEPIGRSGKGMPLHTKIFIGLMVGAIIGLSANLLLGPEHAAVTAVNKYLAGPIGQIFLRLLFMIVMPLVFASISLGVAGLGDLRKVGRVGGKALGFFLLSTALSATLGILLVLAVRPGSRIPADVQTDLLQTYAADASAKVQASEQSTFGIETLVNIVTRNPLKSAVDMDMLGVIFFGIMFGAALTLITAARARPMIQVLEALQDVVIKIVELAMKLAPYGVAGLIFGVTSRFGLDLLAPLARYVGVVLVGLTLHLVLTLSIMVRTLGGLSPRLFYSRIRAAMITAFSTSSSAATLPTNIAVAEQNLGVPSKIAGFVLPLGNTMCMNGTALYEGVTVIFLAQVFGVTLNVPQMIVVMAMSVITAVGAAGVPGGSLPLLVGILAMFGVPGEGIALILGIDRILDMARTTVNITGDLAATCYVGRSEGVWNASMVPAVPMGASLGADESPGWPGPANQIGESKEG
ncbi:MAG TPA: dicarboxylate/amino acid:cation symporter [Longimicrobiales bacterium]|nr:dicarboxylate/amino acid:cation symporter [Longimicrobiales bacterium]